jgi:L-lactate permease
MQGFLIVGTLVALVASLVVIMTRQPIKSQPKPQPQRTQRHLRRLKHQRRRYYQRRMRTMEQRYLVLLAFVVQWQYKQVRT